MKPVFTVWLQAGCHRFFTRPGAASNVMNIQRGTITRINTRGRVTVQLADRVIGADIHSGSGGCIGDIVEGDMRPGLHSWRNVGNSILSVVRVIASEETFLHDSDVERSAPPDRNRRNRADHGA